MYPTIPSGALPLLYAIDWIRGHEIVIPWLCTFAAGMILAAVGAWLQRRERERKQAETLKERT